MLRLGVDWGDGSPDIFLLRNDLRSPLETQYGVGKLPSTGGEGHLKEGEGGSSAAGFVLWNEAMGCLEVAS